MTGRTIAYTAAELPTPAQLWRDARTALIAFERAVSELDDANAANILRYKVDEIRCEMIRLEASSKPT